MNFYDALDSTFFGVLPGGVPVGQVPYQNTFLAPITGVGLDVLGLAPGIVGATSIALTKPDLLRGGAAIPDYFANLYRLGSGDTSQLNPNFTVGDAATQVADAFTFGVIKAPSLWTQQQTPGTQGPTGIHIPDFIGDPFKKLLPVLILLGLGAFALAGSNRKD